MRLRWSFLLIIAFLGCAESEQPAPQAADLIENLPIADRDLLLEPLESALDDVREAIKTDPSIPEQVQSIEFGSAKGEVTLKINGSDTVMFEARLRDGERSEEHIWFWDQGQKLFYSSHRFDGAQIGVGPDNISKQTREYRFYYEESGAKLSSYSRIATGKKALPEVWTPVCLTREEESLLSERLSLLNRRLKASSR